MAMLLIDLMHAVFLGIYHWELGAVMWELIVEKARWRRQAYDNWDNDVADQLTHAYDEFRRWCKAQKLQTSHPRFSMNSLCMRTRPEAPYLKGKAHNLRCLGRWLTSVCLEYTDNMHDRTRSNCLWGFSTSIELLAGSGVVLTHREARMLEVCRHAALTSHGALSSACSRLGARRWLTKPKHHMFDHALRQAVKDRMNPVRWWCFSDEDFIKLALRTAKATLHPTQVERVVCERWLLRYIINAEPKPKL